MRINFLRAMLAILPTLLFANNINAQQTLENIDGWNAYVHLPDDYYQTGSATYPVIIFLPGIGEIGSNAPDVIMNGPGHYIASGDKMQFVINGQTVKPIVISLQPITAWPTAPTVNTKIDSIVRRYRVDVNRIYLTGLSMGGWSIENYVDGYTPLYTNRIASMVAMSAPGPDNGNANMAQYALAGGKWWGFEGTQDYRKMDEIRDAMNNAVSGSARYFNYVGGHGGWNTWYDPSWKDSDGESIYTWMLKQSKGGTPTNQNPIVNAGNDVAITLPVTTVSLKGVASDPDGTIASYAWSKISGPSSATFSAVNSASTNVSALSQGVYQFQLKVTDNSGATAQDVVQVTVNAAANVPPTVNAGADQTITLPTSTVSLSGTAADSDGTIASYSWTKISGPLSATFSTSNTSSTNVSALSQGVYQFQLTVTDNSGATAQDVVQVTVNAASNIPPTVNAGADQSITLPTSNVSLSGTAADSDGSIASYAWTKISGPSSATFSAINSASTNVSALSQGVYQFQLTVTDNSGATAQDIIQVTVNAAANIPPISNAGQDQSITLPVNTVSLSGSGSDADGTITSYLWSQVSGPSSASISNINSPSTDLTGLQEGVYQLQLTVTDNSGASATSITNVTVNPKSGLIGCGCDVTLPRMPDGGIYFTNGKNGINVQPGQKVCIQAGNYPYINLTGLVGTASQPITIINCGGQVIVGSGPTYCISIKNSRYFRFTGTGTQGINYGFKSFWAGGFTGSGMSVRDSSSNFEIDHFEAQNAENGFLCKIDPYNCSPGNYSTGWVIKDVSYHDNYVHNTKGEAYYIGNTASTMDVKDCNGNTITVEPVKIDGIKFYNNISDSSGWDGIQIAAATRAEVYNNRVTNYGVQNLGFQQAGIILGGKSNGSVYNNYINGGTGEGLVVTGFGRIYIYNNVIANAGFDNTANKQDGLSINDNPFPNNKYIGLQVYLFNNTVVNAGRSNIHIFNSYGTMATGNKVYNNLLVKPNYNSPYGSPYLKVDGSTDLDSTNNIQLPQVANANFVGANDFHLASNSSAIDNGRDVFSLGVTTDFDGVSRPQGNAFDVGAYEFKSGDSQNKRPVANAGQDQSITLPVSNVQLNGSGNDSDGTITSLLWTKISGPASYTIVSPSSGSCVINSLSAGVYLFQLTVTDNLGATGLDTVQVTVNAASNVPPVANAGSIQIITLPTSSVSLRGSGTDADGTIVSYAWTKTSGPSTFYIVNSSSAITDITNLVQGTYLFTLTVTDNNGATGSAAVQVTVNVAANIPPVANAGSNQSIILPASTVSLSGTGTDADGTISSYSWTKVSGPATSNIINPSSAVTDVSGLSQGTYQFKLTVTDNKGATGSSTVQVIVNPAANVAPIANAGSNQTITLPTSTVSLRGSGTDTDGTISSYAWAKTSGPSTFYIVNSSSAVTDITNLVQGTYQFSLTVTDNKGATASAAVQVTVNTAANIAPIANAGINQIITLPTSSASLQGSGTDADGTISSYAWTKTSGPSTFYIVNSSSAVTDITNLVQGIYQFSLTVTDNKGATANATVQVTVNAAANVAPVANAGSNQTITLPASTVSLRGSGTDVDGTISSYLWTKVSGPATSNIVNPSSAVTDVSGLSQGTYQFKLTVTDNKGATGSSTVQVIVNPAANIAPVANAGNNQTITLPTSTVSLRGSGTDADGTIASYAWAKVSGPSAFTIASPASANTNVTGLIAGTYQFKLTVKDNSGASASSLVTITVKPALNVPVVNPSGNQTITLPVSSVQLNGSASVVGGTIVSYKWTKFGGPVSYNFSSSNTPVTTVSNLTEGTYRFDLTVTDNNGTKVSGSVWITVKPAITYLPFASAGSNQTILLPTSDVLLSGKGSVLGGTIVSYSWKKVSGPLSYRIASPDSAITRINDLTEGTYRFDLTVVDGKGNVAQASVWITVLKHAQGLLDLSLDAVKNATVSIFPNPVNDVANISINSGKKYSDMSMVITDINGRTFMKRPIAFNRSSTVEKVNLSNLSKGVYIVTVYFDGQNPTSAKLIKL